MPAGLGASRAICLEESARCSHSHALKAATLEESSCLAAWICDSNMTGSSIFPEPVLG